MCWGIPFLFLQYLRWRLTGEHIYNFLKEFSWIQLIFFEAFLYFLAVTIDYTLTLRHGLKLTIKAMGSKERLLEVEKKKQDEDAQNYLSEEEESRSPRLKPKAKAK